MDKTIQTLLAINNTLNSIEVKGESNLDKLSGSIKAINNLIKEINNINIEKSDINAK